jgi:PPM family protein phosphatase
VKNIFKSGFSNINRLFGTPGKEKPNSGDQPLKQVQATVPLKHPSYYPQQLQVVSGQSTGLVREHNEDALFTMGSTILSGESQLPFGLFIVADGMGGHQHGEIASGVAVRTSVEYLSAKLFPRLTGMQSEPQEESLQEILENCVAEVNQNVIRKAPGGGTTLTLAVLIGSQLTIAHVGDSRAYFIYNDGHSEVITQDHSLVNRLVELGEITEDEAAVHPRRNVLYRAIGQVEYFKPDINTFLFPEACHLLLCSDGLWGVIPQEELIKIVTNNSNPSEACFKLVETANSAGGPDNISVILAHFMN